MQKSIEPAGRIHRVGFSASLRGLRGRNVQKKESGLVGRDFDFKTNGHGSWFIAICWNNGKLVYWNNEGNRNVVDLRTTK